MAEPKTRFVSGTFLTPAAKKTGAPRGPGGILVVGPKANQGQGQGQGILKQGNQGKPSNLNPLTFVGAILAKISNWERNLSPQKKEDLEDDLKSIQPFYDTRNELRNERNQIGDDGDLTENINKANKLLEDVKKFARKHGIEFEDVPAIAVDGNKGKKVNLEQFVQGKGRNIAKNFDVSYPGDRVVIFSWNADGVRICENGNIAFYKNEKPEDLNCVIPTFIDQLLFPLIDEEKDANGLEIHKKADIVVIGTQDESGSSLLHSKYLENYMKSKGFLKYEFISISGGETASYRKVSSKIIGRDKYAGDSRDNNISVYYSVEYADSGKIKRTAVFKSGYSKKLEVDLGFGDNKRICTANAVYFEHQPKESQAGNNRLKKYAFINIQMARGNEVVGERSEREMREYIKAGNMVFLSNVFESLIRSKKLDIAPDYVFLFGDFESECTLENEKTGIKTLQEAVVYITGSKVIPDQNVQAQPITRSKLEAFIKQTDEITRLRLADPPYPLYSELNEGLTDDKSEDKRGRGPLFRPSWRMADKRSEIACNSGSPSSGGEGEKYPVMDSKCYSPEIGGLGWRDRIFYFVRTKLEDSYIKCGYYNTIDKDGLEYSSHAAVCGSFYVK